MRSISRPQALRARDHGLRRLRLATRSLVAVSVGAAGLFSVIAARAQAGNAKAVPASSGRAPALARPATPAALPAPDFDNPRSDDAPSTNLAPPPTLPAPGYQYDPAPVVSGAT
jgi:hypothetical protein